jgi:hypothetical protein
MSNVYSLTQRWSPFAGNNEKGEPARPHLQILMNETTGSRLVANMTDEPVHVMDLAGWVGDQIPLQESELVLDKLNWVPVFQLLYPNCRIRYEARPAHLHDYLQELARKSAEHNTSDDYCLLELFGPEVSLRFYREAWEYLLSDPLVLALEARPLDFRSRSGAHYQVSFDPQGEPGFLLKDPCGEFCLGVGYGTAAFVDAQDLELLEEARIDFFADQYPWILTRQPEGLTREWLDDIIWLLANLAAAVRNPKRRSSQGRSLMQIAQAPLGRKARTKSGSVSRRAPSIKSMQ